MPICKNPYRGKERIMGAVTDLGPEYGCGQCLPCRISKARVWTHRLLLESKCHDESIFVTLTYDDTYLPRDASVRPREIQKFMKRVRHHAGFKVRYYGVGEYGEKSNRPHYHLMIFGIGAVMMLCPEMNQNRYFSERRIIEKSWKKGHVFIGEVNKTTCRYITGYVTKWMDEKEDLDGRHKEFMRCSLKPGLGSGYMKKVAKKLCTQQVGEIPVVRELMHGRKKLPLGRYLTHQLAIELDRVWELEKDSVERICEEYISNKNILEEKEVKRRVKAKQIESRHEIYKRKEKV